MLNVFNQQRRRQKKNWNDARNFDHFNANINIFVHIVRFESHKIKFPMNFSIWHTHTHTQLNQFDRWYRCLFFIPLVFMIFNLSHWLFHAYKFSVELLLYYFIFFFFSFILFVFGCNLIFNEFRPLFNKTVKIWNMMCIQSSQNG